MIGLREGTMLRDRWRIDAKIGRGTMATVWAATHRNGDRVAIKVLHPELLDEGTIKQRFLREAYVANAIAHPGVVRVIDDDALPDGSPFLVMDLLVGDTLEAYRKKRGGKLQPEEVVGIVDQLLDILDAAHKKNVVHRDLKPENLFIETDGRVRILDFGLARLIESSEVATQAGALLGTPEFMAPEQAAGKTADVDGQSDLWSLGATAFLLLTGKNVYDAHNLPALINQILSKPPRQVRSTAPEVAPAIAQVIDGALIRDKKQRWQSAGAMREALRRAAGMQSTPSAREQLERADTISSQADLHDPVTSRMARAGGEDAATTLREAARPMSPPTLISEPSVIEPPTVAIPRATPAEGIPFLASTTEAMLNAPVRRPSGRPPRTAAPHDSMQPIVEPNTKESDLRGIVREEPKPRRPASDPFQVTGPQQALAPILGHDNRRADLTPVPAPVPPRFVETRLAPLAVPDPRPSLLHAPEPPPRPAPPPPPKAMSLLLLLGIAGIFAILITAILYAAVLR